MPRPTDPHSPEVDDPPRRGLFGARTSAIAIVVASLATLAVVFVMVDSDDADDAQVQSVPAQPNSALPRDSPPPRTEIAPPPPPRQPVLAMDALGFVDSAARCDPGERAAAIARTERAAVVVCEAADGTYDYRGVRLSDGASLQLDDVRPIAAGFEARNGGTTYRLSPTELVVISGESLQSRDAVIEYRAG